MRHKVAGYRLGRSSSHRKALRRNLITELFRHERIQTTHAKARSCRGEAEKLITKAKKGGLHNHRQILAYIGDQEIAAMLMDEVGPRYADRPGGYTRILKLGPRTGDKAPMAKLELV